MGNNRQQILISGLGGQGVVFLTRVLAEAAIGKGLPVLTSETHGMAQRGGTVVSHLKVGHFSSPLIRLSKADGLLALQAGGLDLYRRYLKPNSWAVVNHSGCPATEFDATVFTVDADCIAQQISHPKSVNLILLGFTLAIVEENIDRRFFCSLKDIQSVLESRMGDNREVMNASIMAIEKGYEACLGKSQIPNFK